jgi:hypothetical protein
MHTVHDYRPASTPAYYLGRSARVWFAALRGATATVVVLTRGTSPSDGSSVQALPALASARIATGVWHGGDEPSLPAMLSAAS